MNTQIDFSNYSNRLRRYNGCFALLLYIVKMIIFYRITYITNINITNEFLIQKDGKYMFNIFIETIKEELKKIFQIIRKLINTRDFKMKSEISQINIQSL